MLSFAFLIRLNSIFYGYRIYDLLGVQILQVISHDGELEPLLLHLVCFIKLLVPVEQALAVVRKGGRILLVDRHRGVILALLVLGEISCYFLVLLLNRIISITLGLIHHLIVIHAALIASSAREKAIAHSNIGCPGGVHRLMLPLNQVLHEEAHVKGLGL